MQKRSIYHNEGPEALQPSAPLVLFQDYNSFWAPLDDLYYSTTSLLLVSRHPDSAIEEVVSHYCPQCLSKYSDDDVVKYANRCASCLVCPCCVSVLTGMRVSDGVSDGVSGDASGKFCMTCSVCEWSSVASGVIGDSEGVLASIVLEKEKNNKATEAFSAILGSLTMASTEPRINDSTTKALKGHETWGMEALAQLDEQKTLKFRMCEPQNESSLHKYLHDNDVLEKENERKKQYLNDIRSCGDLSVLSTFEQRLTVEYTNSTNFGVMAEQLLPQRTYLRAKKMLRCRRDVKQGKMSILIQPKTFPLEGDSSHKLHQGKWFLKDSSACHHIPRVVITKLPNWSAEDSNGNIGGFLHFEVINSKDSSVVVVINAATSEENVDLKLEGISLDDNDQKPAHSNVEDVMRHEKHPPFAFKDNISTLVVPASTVPSYMFLQAYEDELLRDTDLPEVSDFADEDSSSLSWNVLMDAHVAKLCVPVSCKVNCGVSEGNGRPAYAEALFHMTVAEAPAGSDDSAADDINRTLEKNSITVSFRIAFQM